GRHHTRLRARGLAQDEARDGRTPRHVVDPAGERALELLGRAAAARQIHRLAEDLVDHRGVELLLAAEVVEDGRAPDADVGRDVVEPRRLEAALREVALGDRDDLGTRLEAAVAAADGRLCSRSGGHTRLTIILARK